MSMFFFSFFKTSLKHRTIKQRICDIFQNVLETLFISIVKWCSINHSARRFPSSSTQPNPFIHLQLWSICAKIYQRLTITWKFRHKYNCIFTRDFCRKTKTQGSQVWTFHQVSNVKCQIWDVIYCHKIFMIFSFYRMSNIESRVYKSQNLKVENQKFSNAKCIFELGDSRRAAN